MRKLLNLQTLVFILFLFPGFKVVNGQQEENTNSWRISADLVSNYVWRGTPGYSVLGGNSVLAPSIQPTLAFGIGNFEIGAWGSFDFTGSYKETDLYLTYTLKDFSFSISDYYWDGDWLSNRYFDYKSETTKHFLEASISYKGSTIPINIVASTFFYGADKKYDINLGAQDPKKNNYSTYLELGYSFKNCDIFMGITPTDGYYGDGYGNFGSGDVGLSIINLGLTTKKTIKVTDAFEIPVKASFIANPQHEKIYIVLGFTF